MSLVDSMTVQRQRIAKARKVDKITRALSLVTTDDYSDDDLYVARCRLDEWLLAQPQYVQDALVR